MMYVARSSLDIFPALTNILLIVVQNGVSLIVARIPATYFIPMIITIDYCYVTDANEKKYNQSRYRGNNTDGSQSIKNHT